MAFFLQSSFYYGFSQIGGYCQRRKEEDKQQMCVFILFRRRNENENKRESKLWTRIFGLGKAFSSKLNFLETELETIWIMTNEEHNSNPNDSNGFNNCFSCVCSFANKMMWSSRVWNHDTDWHPSEKMLAHQPQWFQSGDMCSENDHFFKGKQQWRRAKWQRYRSSQSYGMQYSRSQEITIADTQSRGS